jgi:uncharacterized oxidoreductase
MRMRDRTVLITGGTSGIGLEFARQLSEANVVIVTGRNLQRLEGARKLLPKLHIWRSDVASEAEVRALHDELVQKFPKLDTLINNAGIMRNIKFPRVAPVEDVCREIDINLSGTIRMVNQFFPWLARQPEALIVNISSGLAFVPFPAAPVYSASKAAIHSFSLALRAQAARTNVRIVELAPPGTETPLFRGEFAEEMQGEKGMDVSRLVNQAIAGIESGRLEIRPGAANVLKIASRVAPQQMLKLMSRMSRLQ